MACSLSKSKINNQNMCTIYTKHTKKASNSCENVIIINNLGHCMVGK